MATVLPLRAAEQITLRNGFEITCNHHGTANRRVRLYMEKGNQNYIEVEPGDIASVERVPDPPPGPVENPVERPLKVKFRPGYVSSASAGWRCPERRQAEPRGSERDAGQGGPRT